MMEKKNFHEMDRIRAIQKIGEEQSQIKREEDTACMICNSGDCDEKNEIVFCDCCGIAVH